MPKSKRNRVGKQMHSPLHACALVPSTQPPLVTEAPPQQALPALCTSTAGFYMVLPYPCAHSSLDQDKEEGKGVEGGPNFSCTAGCRRVSYESGVWRNFASKFIDVSTAGPHECCKLWRLPAGTLLFIYSVTSTCEPSLSRSCGKSCKSPA
eukprot:scaffold317325_cov15-Tisochrysis_lutea.AAC.1